MIEEVELWIRQAFDTRLDSWVKSQDLPVEHENEEFTPPTKGFYLRSTLLMAPAVENDLVEEEEHSGIYQVAVFGPSRIGTGRHMEIVAGLRRLFPLDLILAAGQLKVMQRSPLRSGPGITETDKFMVPTSFEFVTFT